MSENYLIKQQKVILVKDGPPLRVPSHPINTSEEAAEVCRLLVGGTPHEEMHVICLTNKNVPRVTLRVSQGGMNQAAVKPSDIFRPVLLTGLPAFLLTHNHPSGDPTPSAADVEMTRVMIRGCSLLGLVLLDHLVIGDGGVWRSIRDTARLDWENET